MVASISRYRRNVTNPVLMIKVTLRSSSMTALITPVTRFPSTGSRLNNAISSMSNELKGRYHPNVPELHHL